MQALPAQTLALAVPPRRGRFRAYLADHPVAMDWIVVAAATLLAVPLFVGFALQGKWWLFGFLLVQQLSLRARRRSPWAVLVVTVAIDAVLLYQSPNSSVTSAAVLFALYAVAVSAPVLVAMGASVLASVPASVYYAFVYTPRGPEVPDHARYVGIVAAVSLLLMNVIAAGLGAWVRGSREHQAEIRAWAMRRAELASVQERNRIAREMHDVVAHSLTVMVALSDGAATIAPKDPERAQAVLGELSRTGRTALADMRRVLGVLREGPGASLAPSPGTKSLQALVDGFRTAGLPAVLTIHGAPPPQDPAFQLAIFRIVQESLTNALRYARGVGRVEVTVARAGDHVLVRVEDDGGPHDAAPPHLGTGGGIAGMRERAALYGGTLRAGPRPGGGWVVETELYWTEGEH